MSDRDLEMVTLREQRDDAIQRMVRAERKLERVAEVRDWLGQNNEDAEYDLAIVALNEALKELDDE